MKKVSALGFALLLWVAIAVTASAYDVVIVYNDLDGPSTDLQTALLADTRVDSVGMENARTATPSVVGLQAYDLVFVQAFNGFWHNDAALGDVLADYVDAGGSLVLDIGAWCSMYNPIKGRLWNEGYLPLKGVHITLGALNLGTFDAQHPIMSGVYSFAYTWYAVGAVLPGADVVAFWDNGEELAGTYGAVVCLALSLVNGTVTGSPVEIARNAAAWVYAWRQKAVIDSVVPGSALPGSVEPVVIDGDYFIYENTTVSFAGPGLDIDATAVEVIGFRNIFCNVDLTNAEPGDYDLVVNTPAGQTILADAFTVTDPNGDDDDDDSGDDDDDTAGDDDDSDSSPNESSGDDDDDDDGGCCG
jgi:hypothetical protein